MTSPHATALTYAQAGVDIEAGDRAVDLMKAAVARTHGPEVMGGIGGFAGLFDARALVGMRAPMLVSSTDGVGTKVAIAQALDRHDTIGQDLVAMVVDDIVVTGARPLFMTDYIACGRVHPERIAAVVSGIAAACEQTGTALIGGETAEHPGLMGEHEYDLAGAATGVVERGEVLGGDRIRMGDVAVALGSSGLHANGFSLVRRVFDDHGWSLDRHVPEFGATLGAELLTPTRLYTAVCLDLIAAGGVHGLSHVTGGGLAANLSRVLPPGLGMSINRSWTPSPVFAVVSQLGSVPRVDLERTLNLGVGMVAILAPDRVDRAIAICAATGVPAWVLGELTDRDELGAQRKDDVASAKGVHGGLVRLTGDYPGAPTIR